MDAEMLLVAFVAFLTVAALVSYAASRMRVPYTVAMVLTGLGVSALHLDLAGSRTVELLPDLILLAFLPGLLFEASYHIDLRQLRNNLRPIVLLAIPGVLLSTLVLGFLLNQWLDLPWVDALLFGVLISATDPIAVVALLKNLGVDKRLGIIMEGESLFNDGVAIVGYTMLAGVAAGTETFSLSASLTSFVVTVIGGVLLGGVVGLIFGELIKRTDDPLLDITLTTILAYGTYLLAEEVLHGVVSPVIAVVIAGVVVGNYGSSGRHSATSTNMIVTFWEYVVFVINSAVFLLLGLEVQLGALVENIVPVLLTIAAALLARAIVVYLLRLVINKKSPNVPVKWGHVMFWGGMRGAVSIALALSLPAALSSRELLVTIAFGYVLFSVVVQGLSMSTLIQRLGLAKRSEKQLEFERSLARLTAAEASVKAVDRLVERHVLNEKTAEQIRTHSQRWISQHERDVFRIIADEPSVADANLRLVQQELGQAQKQALRGLLQQGIISKETFEEAGAQIEGRLQNQAIDGSKLMTWFMENGYTIPAPEAGSGE